MRQITLDQLNRLDRDAFVAELGGIYEHAPWVAETVEAARPFRNLNALLQAMTSAVRNAGQERQFALIRSHPDLAGRAARAGTISADSKHEQASAGLDRLTDAEFAAFQQMNAAYRAKFGMPFIICVRRHGKESVLRLFEQRLHNDIAAERDTALAEILRIASLRLDQRVAAPDRLPVHGQLSTHVLDTHGGFPAYGLAIELHQIEGSAKPRLLSQAITNQDGRPDRPLLANQPIPIARYELRFDVGGYFARGGVTAADPPFLGIVPVRFAVAEPEAHYHVPLLVTPFSYATYRGS